MYGTLDYRNPRHDSEALLHPRWAATFRAAAGLLAAGATLWSLLFCVSFLIAPLSALLLFGPGYVVTAGYYHRAFGRPSRALTRVIWAASLLVQGSWLSFWLWHADASHFADWLSAVVFVWWAGAAIASLLGVMADPGYPAAV